MSNSMMNITRPPLVMAVKRELVSCMNACGRRAMIPIMIIKEIPLPTPLSVMRSPNQRTNILPAARMTVAVIMKAVQFKPGAKAP